MDFMESRGLMENTVFVYISDNGWEQDANVEYWSPGTTTTTTPSTLRADWQVKDRSMISRCVRH